MKFIIKRFILLLLMLVLSPMILLARAGFVFRSETIFYGFACGFSLVPGKIGSYLRVAYYKGTIKSISSDCYIGFGSFFTKRGAEVGNYATIGAYCIIGNAKIKDNVLIASRVSLLSGKYQHGDTGSPSFLTEQNRFDAITIGKGTWVGEGSIIAADVGEDCIVAFGAAVTRNIPDNYLAIGNPARPIKRPKSG
jgi:acetyltransferase-like isoleucine patch superfamily enzyme